MNRDWLTIAQAADVAQLSERTIRRGLKDPVRMLRHVRVARRVRIRRIDLNIWLEAHVESASTPKVPADVSDTAKALLLRLVGTPGAPDDQPDEKQSNRTHAYNA